LRKAFGVQPLCPAFECRFTLERALAHRPKGVKPPAACPASRLRGVRAPGCRCSSCGRQTWRATHRRLPQAVAPAAATRPSPGPG